MTPPFRHASTASFEAFHKYVQGMREFEAREPGYLERFGVLMLEAIALDSTFGRAYSVLGMLVSTSHRTS